MTEEGGLESVLSQCKFLNHLIVSQSVLAFLPIISKSFPDSLGFIPVLPCETANSTLSANRKPKLRVDTHVLWLSYKENLGLFDELEPDFSLSDLLLSCLVYFGSLKCIKT